MGALLEGLTVREVAAGNSPVVVSSLKKRVAFGDAGPDLDPLSAILVDLHFSSDVVNPAAFAVLPVLLWEVFGEGTHRGQVGVGRA